MRLSLVTGIASVLALSHAASAGVTVYYAQFSVESRLNSFNAQQSTVNTQTSNDLVSADVDPYNDPYASGSGTNSLQTSGSFSGDATSGYTMQQAFSGDLSQGVGAHNQARLYLQVSVDAGTTLDFEWSGTWTATGNFSSQYYAGIFIQGPVTAYAADQPNGDFRAGGLSFDYTFTTAGIYTIDMTFQHNAGGLVQNPLAYTWNGTSAGSLIFNGGGGGAVPGLGALAPLAAAGLTRRRRR